MSVTKLLECLIDENYVVSISENAKPIVRDALVACYGEATHYVAEVQKKVGQRSETGEYNFYDIPQTHSYRGISEFLKAEPAAFDYLSDSISNAMSIFPEYSKVLNELDNHIKLENLRIYREEQLEKLIGNSYKEMKKLHCSLQQKFEKDLKDIQNQTVSKIEISVEKAEEIQSRFVSIVGMFSSIIFALFGGLNMISSIVGGIQNAKTVPQILMLISMFGMLFLSLYILVIVILFFIGKVVQLNGRLLPNISLSSKRNFSLSKLVVVTLVLMTLGTFFLSLILNQPTVNTATHEEVIQLCLSYDLKKLKKEITGKNETIEEICSKYSTEK